MLKQLPPCVFAAQATQWLNVLVNLNELGDCLQILRLSLFPMETAVAGDLLRKHLGLTCR